MSLAEHAPVYNLCRYCLMCRHVCPVGRTTKREANTPHGWALLIASVDRGQMRWDTEAVDTLYECAQCGLCYDNCVTERPLPSAIAAARADVFAAGAAPASVVELEARLRRWGNPYRAMEQPVPVGTAPAALFVGTAQYLRPQTLTAARKLLDALGIEHVAVGAGLSSAFLPFALGLRDAASALAQAALEQVAASGASRLIVLSPEDARAFGDALPELGLALPVGVERIELMTLLAEAVEAGGLTFHPLDATVTYHDPAHTPHFPGRAAQARRVLAALFREPLRELFWREGRAAPGGAVGGLEWTQPALAERMTRERLAEAAATGAGLLVTDDPAALAHFEQVAGGAGIPIAGLFELLAQQVQLARFA